MIYIVQGSTGKYCDRRDWLVAAYLEKDKAEAHATAAKRWHEEHNCINWPFNKSPKNQNPFDPWMISTIRAQTGRSVRSP